MTFKLQNINKKGQDFVRKLHSIKKTQQLGVQVEISFHSVPFCSFLIFLGSLHILELFFFQTLRFERQQYRERYPPELAHPQELFRLQQQELPKAVSAVILTFILVMVSISIELPVKVDQASVLSQKNTKIEIFCIISFLNKNPTYLSSQVENRRSL